MQHKNVVAAGLALAVFVGATMLLENVTPVRAEGEILTTIPLLADSGPEGVVVGSDGTAFVSNYTKNTVARIPADAAQPAQYFPTSGEAPYSVAVDSNGLIFTANRASANVSRINPNDFAVPRLIPTGLAGAEPWGLAISSNNTVYVSNYRSDTIVRIDPGSNIVNSTIPLLAGCRPKDMAISTDNRLFVACSGSGLVARIALATGVVEYFPLENNSSPRGIALATDGALYVTDINLDKVYRLAPETMAITTALQFPADAFPADAAADPDGSVLVAIYGTDEVLRMRGDVVEATIKLAVGAGPDRIAVGVDGIAYTADNKGNTVTRIDPLRPIPSPTPSPSEIPTESPTPTPTPSVSESSSPSQSDNPPPTTTATTKTLKAIKIRRKTAVLRGKINTENESQTVYMRIAGDKNLTKKVKVLKVRKLDAGVTHVVRKPVRKLSRKTSYWFQVEARSSSGVVVVGIARSFRTK